MSIVKHQESKQNGRDKFYCPHCSLECEWLSENFDIRGDTIHVINWRCNNCVELFECLGDNYNLRPLRGYHFTH